jgi:hypothetical protein
MIGFSLPKLLLFALLVAVVWFGYRYVNRVEEIRRAVREEVRRRQSPGRRSATIEAEDLVKCSRCGTYVAARGAGSCGRPDCPWSQ